MKVLVRFRTGGRASSGTRARHLSYYFNRKNECAVDPKCYRTGRSRIVTDAISPADEADILTETP